VKALSLLQPWASAIMLGYKQIETRSWRTDYRGRIAIHASKRFTKDDWEFMQHEHSIGNLYPPGLPLGAIIGLATIVSCERTEYWRPLISELEDSYGDYSNGRWGWKLAEIEPFEKPIPCKGSLGLWTVPEGLLE